MEPEDDEQLGPYEQAQRQRLAQDTPPRPVTTPTLPKAPAPMQPTVAPPEVDMGVRRALAATAEDSGDEGTINRLATLTGMAPEVLRALDPSTIAQMAREQGVLANTQDTPVLRGKFADPDFARTAAGDVPSLAEIERQMLAIRQAELQREAAKPKPAAPKAEPQGDGFARMYGGAGDAMREALPNVPNALASGMARLSSGIYGIPRALSETNDRFASWVAGRPLESGVSQFFAERQEAAQASAEAWMPKVDDPTMQAALSGLASVPSSAAGLALALLTGGSAAPFVGAGFAGGVTAGDEYGTARAQGMDPLSSAAYGLGQGSVETLTEMLPMKWLIGDITAQTPFVQMFVRNLAAEGMTEQVATAGQDFLAWAYLPENADKPFSAYLAERPGAAYETLVATMVASGIQTGVIGVATEIQKQSQQDTERSELGLDALDAMVEAAAESTLRDANAEQFEQYVESLAQDAPIRAAYMSPEAFAAAAAAEGVTPQQLAQEFGVEGQVDASLATGAPLEIPLGRFVSRVSGRDNRDAFMNGVSWSAFTYSRDQLKVLPDGMRDRLMAEADQLAQAAAEDETINAQVETIRAGIEEQLNATGRFIGDPNRVYSRVASIYYANLARRLGKTPEEVFTQYPLKVVGESLLAGSQAATARSEAFVEQEGLRAKNFAGQVAQPEGFAYLDENPDTTQGALAEHLGISIGQAAAIRKAWKESRGVPTLQPRRGQVYEQLDFEPLANMAAQDLATLPEDQWNDTIKATKYAAYALPEGVTEASLPRGYVVVRVGDRAYAVTQKHLEERRNAGAKVTRVEQGARGEYYPSDATINLLRRADLSTFIHELGHHFLELQTGIAFDLQNRVRGGGALTTGEQELLDDTLLWLRSVGLKPPIDTGRPSDFVAQDDVWVLRFFENYEPNANDNTIAVALRKLADERKLPVLKVFKTSAGRIITFPADEYSHNDARTILEHYKLPDANLQMQHGEIRWGQTLRDVHWYDRTGALVDTLKYEQGETSFRAAANSTPVERAIWFDDNVFVSATPGGGRTLEIRSKPELKKPDIILDLTPSKREEGAAGGFIVDLQFRGTTFRDTDAKNSPERSRQAHVMLVKSAMALRAFTERELPGYYSFVGADPGLDRLYDLMLRGYDFGYEARVDEFYDYDSKAGDKPVLRRSFLLVRPDLVNEIPLELYNAQVLADGARRIKQYARTDIVRPGNKDILGNSINPDGVGSGATGARSYKQSHSPKREAVPLHDITLVRASEILSEEQFEAFKLARTGMSNDDIAASMDENGDLTRLDVAQFLAQARRKGFFIPKAKQAMALGADTLRVIALSAAGRGPKEIAETVYGTSDKAGQVRVLRNRHKAAIEKYKAERAGKYEQGEIFFSALKRAVEGSKQVKATAAQWKATLRNTPGVKAEEIQWSGIEDWLDAQEGAVTQAAVNAFLDANGVQVSEVKKLENSDYAEAYVAQDYDEDGIETWVVYYGNDELAGYFETQEEAADARREINDKNEVEYQTQFESYTLPGGTDYTELLLTLPNIKGPATHWEEPNVVAHARFKTRRGPNGEKVLAIEEVQSDWHQKGREQGYAAGRASEDEIRAADEERMAAQVAYSGATTALRAAVAADPEANPFVASQPVVNVARAVATGAVPASDAAGIVAALQEFDRAKLALNETTQRYTIATNGGDGIPRAPFANNGWAALVLKRMIRWAADNGYDQLAWTPGAVQAERYDLGKVAETLYLTTLPNGTEMLEVQTTDDRVLNFAIGDQTLEDHVGAEAAKALREKEPYELKGYDDGRVRRDLDVKDLRVGEGRGMLAFYDKILVNEANKLGKKYGAKVGVTNVSMRAAAGDMTRNEHSAKFDFHSLPITPELKAAALEGMPLFQPIEGPKLSPAEERMFSEQMRRKPGDPLINAEERAFFRDAMRGLPDDANELDIWQGMTLDQKTFYHEMFARQTEQYFMRGDAPVPMLQRLFNKVRAWMTTVYKSLAELNVEMSDEVKGVFDRMFAASQDIAEAQRENVLNPMFAVRPDHMTEPEWEEYQALNAQAVDDAEATLSQRSLRDVKWLGNARSREIRRLQNEAREQRKAMRAQVTSEVMAEPVNIARRFLSRGEQEDGTPVDPELTLLDPEGNLVKGKPKLSIAGLEAMYPEGSGVDWKKLGFGKWGMAARDGLHPDALAPMLGYESGDQLVRELLTAEDAQEKISGITDQRMLERYGDLTDEKAIARAADEAVYSGLRGRVLAAEYAALTAALGQRSVINEAAQAAAQKLVSRMPHRKLSPARFMAAERQAAKRAEEALRKNDLAGAAAAKKDQILSFYLTREVMAKQKERDKAMGQFQKILRAKKDSVSKSRNFDLVQAARAVLASYGMAQMQNKPMDYLKALERYDPMLYASLEPTLLGAMSSGMTIKDLTVEQFMGVRDVVQQLWDLAREEMLVEINGQQMDLADVTGQLNKVMEDRGADPNRPVTETPSAWQRTLRVGESLAAALRRVESWARLQDGDTPGPFTKFLWRPISQAATRYRADMSVRMRQFRDLFKAIEPSLKAVKIHAPELGYTFRGKADLLHAILHTGNDSNKRKLLLGYRWATEDANGDLDTSRWDAFMARMAREGVVTVADYQFAQGIWDMLEEIKPLAQKAHRRVFGRYFSEITANPVPTPFGEFRGGYVPAIADDFFNTDMALKRAHETLEGHDSSMFPSPSKGFTEARVEYNRPLQLDLRILGSHIDTVLRFAHMAAPTRDVLRVLRSKGVERNMHDLHPSAIPDLLLPWLQRAAKQTNEFPLGGKPGRAVTKISNGLRARANMGIMFGNLINVLQQPTGLFNAAAFKGFKKRELANALVRFLRDPAGTHRAIRAASQVIATRADSQAIAMRDEVQAIAEARGPTEKATAWFARHTYFAQIALQNQQDAIVWLAALESSKSRGETEAEAVEFADAVVRQTQGSAVPEDISRFETGTGWHKVLVSMYGYFNMWGNQLSTEFRTAVHDLGLAKGKGRMLYVYMVGFMAPAVLAQFIADALRGDLPDDEDEEEPLLSWLEWFFGSQAKGATAMVPLVGSVGMAGVNAFNEKPYDDRVMSSPAISVLEAAARTPANIYDFAIGEGDGSRTFKDAMTLLTLMTGVPFQALNRPVGYAIDVLEGDVEPEDGMDAARGAIAGR